MSNLSATGGISRGTVCAIYAGERHLSEQMKQLTIEQARAVQAISQVQWKLVETSEGWTVQTGEAKLVVTNGRRLRVFKSLEAAVRQLRDRVGVTNFQVETVRT